MNLKRLLLSVSFVVCVFLFSFSILFSPESSIHMNDHVSVSMHEMSHGSRKVDLSTRVLNEVKLMKEDKEYFHEFKKEGWTLIWKDEFQNDQIDETKWNSENWAAEKNNELQFYTPENVHVNNGSLQLVSRKERFGGRDYTSGAIHTMDKFSFKYGKAEIRARLPSGQGVFPAFWMMPNIEGVWLPEIDIMEMLGHKPNEIWMVVHWLNEHGELKSKSNKYISENDFSNDFHTYAVKWSEEKITWLIDDVEVFTTDAYIPDNDMYLYLNTAIGGNWPGSPDETTIFPQVFEIEYVRVYEKNEEGI
ncbi:glycoside hydrolase family 16 protein [Evansella cellulosilytica]|uniref:Glycoside hydrolase family 16 n=1 Tax=Evansella cellulosilytica (strain ATCC 21833 / DSM 2522 / FERM P-1141 / JCM 9156 / N-4) TaxID=649639 RepID=E6TUD7_EVAC2|nr:glycoside hydrolase family 16 protein [Evansella cellulosilytica]ADU29693.1 glycoside hydrolase family 16 [Evansella cellulosilytica DSM 2522]